MIIGIVGKKGSGKDTLGEILVSNHNWTKKSFAQPIKDLVHQTFGIDKAILSGNGGEREFRELPMKFWFNYSARDLLQIIGTGFRDLLHKDIWVKILEKEIKTLNKNIVITDVRFPNEIDMVNKNGFCVKIVREGYNGDDHISEKALDNYKFEHVIYNNGTLLDLENRFESFLKKRGI